MKRVILYLLAILILVLFCPAVDASSPGIKVGTTWYENQHNGTMSRMISRKPDESLFFVWTNGPDSALVERHVYFNSTHRFPDSVGIQLDAPFATKAGYATCDATSDNRAVVAYHASVEKRTAIHVESVIDTFLDGPYVWPHVAVDDLDNIHIVASSIPVAPDTPYVVYYCRSVDAGLTFSAWQAVDSLKIPECEIQTSRHSGKVVIVYNHTVPWLIEQTLSDIMFVESTDNGETWDWSAKVNVTNTSSTDSLVPYCDVSAIYDELDDLHLVYAARHWEEGQNLHYNSTIMHWSETGGFSTVYRDTLQGWPRDRNQGSWRLTADRPSIGIDPSNGNLFCVFTASLMGDTSAAGMPNNELWATWSTDNGSTWAPVTNLTNSPSPGADPGLCDDDEYPSLAEIVNDTLHILYLNDKDAGCYVCFPYPGAKTLNPMMYLRVPVDSLTGIGENSSRPLRTERFSLAQNAPNPCAETATIQYELPKDASVRLLVYDAAGRLVETLVDKWQPAGVYWVRWNGEDRASGIYFYRLKAGEFVSTKKMVLID